MATWRRPSGRPYNLWRNRVQEDALTIYRYALWISEIARCHGAAQR